MDPGLQLRLKTFEGYLEKVESSFQQLTFPAPIEGVLESGPIKEMSAMMNLLSRRQIYDSALGLLFSEIPYITLLCGRDVAKWEAVRRFVENKKYTSDLADLAVKILKQMADVFVNESALG